MVTQRLMPALVVDKTTWLGMVPYDKPWALQRHPGAERPAKARGVGSASVFVISRARTRRDE